MRLSELQTLLADHLQDIENYKINAASLKVAERLKNHVVFLCDLVQQKEDCELSDEVIFKLKFFVGSSKYGVVETQEELAALNTIIIKIFNLFQITDEDRWYYKYFAMLPEHLKTIANFEKFKSIEKKFIEDIAPGLSSIHGSSRNPRTNQNDPETERKAEADMSTFFVTQESFDYYGLHPKNIARFFVYHPTKRYYASLIKFFAYIKPCTQENLMSLLQADDSYIYAIQNFFRWISITLNTKKQFDNFIKLVTLNKLDEDSQEYILILLGSDNQDFIDAFYKKSNFQLSKETLDEIRKIVDARCAISSRTDELLNKLFPTVNDEKIHASLSADTGSSFTTVAITSITDDLLKSIYSELTDIVKHHPEFWQHHVKMGSTLKLFNLFGGEKIAISGKSFNITKHVKVLFETLDEKSEDIRHSLQTAFTEYSKLDKSTTKSENTRSFYNLIDKLIASSKTSYDNVTDLNSILKDMIKIKLDITTYEKTNKITRN